MAATGCVPAGGPAPPPWGAVMEAPCPALTVAGREEVVVASALRVHFHEAPVGSLGAGLAPRAGDVLLR